MNRNQDTVTSTGAVCQQLEHSQPLSRRYEPIPRSTFNLNYKGFLGGVPVKHRKIRRVNPAGVSGSPFNESRRQRCLFFFVIRGAGVTSRTAICGHRSRAGCLSANQAMPVRFRLTAPIFNIRRAPACAAGSPKLCLLGAAPRRRAIFVTAGWPNGKAAAS